MPVLTTKPATGVVDDRVIAAMRLILAASGLLIIYLVPSEPSRFVVTTYFTCILYVVYSVILYALARWWHTRWLTAFYNWAHWIDVGWYAALIAFTSGTSSIFFFGFMFAILVASFRWGFAAGLRVSVVSVILFMAVGLASVPGHLFELDRFLIRPIFLLVLGYMMAYWGSSEIRYKRELALLRELATLSNPRFGIDRTVGVVLERARTFYTAQSCLLITGAPGAETHQLRVADGHDGEAAILAHAVPPELARQLLCLPPDVAAVYRTSRARRWSSAKRYHAVDVVTGAHTEAGRESSERLAVTLEAESFLTVPVRFHNEAVGRLYLTSPHPAAFQQTDTSFVLQVIAQVVPVLDNIRLVDRLASSAAAEERQRLARDLHDGIIQPYHGLRIGLTAIDQQLAHGRDGRPEVQRLIARIDDHIAELRGHIHGLRHADGAASGLVAAVRGFAEKFAAATQLDVRVEAPTKLQVNDRLAAEVFHMVEEGLSNIRRHTHATRATVILARHAQSLVVRIENDRATGDSAASFTPWSITERAAALGGQARVEQQGETATAVVVDIPL